MSLPAIRRPDDPPGVEFQVYDPYDMEALRQPDMTEEEYLATEPYSEIKREFLGGAVYAMAGADRSHNRIAINLTTLLNTRLRGRRCEAFGSDMQLRVNLPGTDPASCSYYYPDAMISCDPTDRNDRFIAKPFALFEVISRSTRRIDEQEKFRVYLSIGTLQAYLRIEQDRPVISLNVRTSEGWKLEQVAGLDGVVHLPALEIELPLADLYERVEFPPSRW